jgi:phosphate transport system substrate-binding protein
MPIQLYRLGVGLASSTLRRRRVLAGAALAMLLGGGSVPGFAASSELRRLRVGGTGMALAAMGKVAESFAATQPSIVVEVLPSLGTAGGLSALAAGAIDLALYARGLNDAERAKGLQSQAYARTPIAFVAAIGTDIERITSSDLVAIFSGSMQTWPDGVPVRLVRREPSDADWAMLRGLSPAMARAVEIALQRSGLLIAATDQENGNALERMRGSFGVMSVGQLRAEARRLKALVFDGATPLPEELAAGRYPLSRTLYVAWPNRAGPDVTEFLAFLGTEPSQTVLTRLGHIPLSSSTGT